MDNLELIKTSFENWYNARTPYKDKVSVLVNYRDEQTLAIKAYHKVTAEVVVIGIKNHLSYTTTVCSVTDNYNHSNTTEEEAKDSTLRKLLEEMFHYIYIKSI